MTKLKYPENSNRTIILTFRFTDFFILECSRFFYFSLLSILNTTFKSNFKHLGLRDVRDFFMIVECVSQCLKTETFISYIFWTRTDRKSNLKFVMICKSSLDKWSFRFHRISSTQTMKWECIPHICNQTEIFSYYVEHIFNNKLSKII